MSVGIVTYNKKMTCTSVSVYMQVYIALIGLEKGFVDAQALKLLTTTEYANSTVTSKPTRLNTITSFSQAPRLDTTTEAISCPLNLSRIAWMPSGVYCYGLSSYSATFDGAEKACQSANGSASHLVSILNTNENDYVSMRLEEKHINTSWIGLVNLNAGGYSWTDSSKYNYSNWATAFGRNITTGDICPQLAASNLQEWRKRKWEKVDCNQKNHFVCKTNPGEIINDCFSNPCFMGTCEDQKSGYLCLCRDGFSGINCEKGEIIENCFSNPCFMGTCEDQESVFLCLCRDGFSGINCEKASRNDSNWDEILQMQVNARSTSTIIGVSIGSTIAIVVLFILIMVIVRLRKKMNRSSNVSQPNSIKTDETTAEWDNPYNYYQNQARRSRESIYDDIDESKMSKEKGNLQIPQDIPPRKLAKDNIYDNGGFPVYLDLTNASM